MRPNRCCARGHPPELMCSARKGRGDSAKTCSIVVSKAIDVLFISNLLVNLFYGFYINLQFQMCKEACPIFGTGALVEKKGVQTLFLQISKESSGESKLNAVR